MSENKIARPLEVIETEINFYKQQTATGIIEIGKRLIEAKSLLEHGQWGKWLEEKVDFSRQTANKFMRIADEYSNVNAPLQLGSDKLFKLLDVPLEDRDSFLSTSHPTSLGKNKTVDEMTTREVEKAVKEWKLKEQTEDIWNIVDKEYDENIYDIPITDLKPFPSHEKYFWNMTGKNYVNFITSIDENGIYEPIIITRDKMIISGHQRVRACNDLGINSIPARYLHGKNPQNYKLDKLLLSYFIHSNMHPRWAVFYIALAWDNLFFGDGNKFDYYLKQAEEKDDSKLVEYLENKLKEIEAKRNDKLCSLT